MREPSVPRNLESYGGQFWYTARTLSLSFVCDPYFPSTWYQNDGAPVPAFPNLVALTIEVESVETIQWIVREWLTPMLRSLTIISPYPGMWIEPICHHYAVLEHLAVLSRSRITILPSIPESSFPTPLLIMPKLKSLCLSIPDNISFPNDFKSLTLLRLWLSTVRAPALEHFCLHIREYVYEFSFLRQRVQEVFRIYPSIQKLSVCDTRWIDNVCDALDVRRRKSRPILTTQDIINWCEHVKTVEIVGVRTRRSFTKESILALISQESLD